MNSSIYSADRTTHLRIVVVALAIGIAIVGLGTSARVSAIGTLQANAYSSQIQKAGRTSHEAVVSQTAHGRT